MKTLIMKMLCISLCVALVCGIFTVSAQVDNNVGLEVTFDRDIYVPGDVAVATVYLTGLSDEASENKTIGLFETHLTFDATELDFVPVGEDRYDTGDVSQWFVDLSGTDDVNVFQITENHDNVIVLAFDKETSFVPVCDEDGKMAVAQIVFDVLGASDDIITLGFDDTYTNVVAVSKVNDQPFNEYTCTAGDAAEAQIKDYLFADSVAYIDEEGVITGTLMAGVAEGTGYIIAKLYDAETGMLAAPVNIAVFEGAVSVDGGRIFARIPTDGTYKIEYYLWSRSASGSMNMKPLAQKVTADVVAIQ